MYVFTRQKLVWVFIAAFILVVALLTNGKDNSLPNPISRDTKNYTIEKDSLKKEFNDAYISSTLPTNNVREFDITAAESTVSIVDGLETNVWSYNGNIPGPELRVKIGEKVRVTFKNNLPDETTIHWHGVRVENEMDGVPGVTQDPIQPGESFVYGFTPKDAGTFWFHPHVRGSEQVERGLYGTLVVEDEEKYPYSKDVVWILDDWLLVEQGQIYPNFNTNHDLMHDGRWGNVITVNGMTDETLNVNAGERVRLRLVNTSNGRVYAPDFGRLDAKVIAVDGIYVSTPFSASGFELAPGNRIDVDIKVQTSLTNQTIDVKDYFTRNVNTLAKIKVSDTVVATPDFSYPTNLKVPQWTNARFLPTDYTIRMNAQRTRGMGMGGMGLEWTLNGQAYPNTQDITLKAGEFQKITYTNDSFRLHPMHLHGQFFKVLTRNGQPVDEPYFRDTVLVHSKETVEIGLIPFDKGAWAHHCHILEHAEAGMMQIINVL